METELIVKRAVAKPSPGPQLSCASTESVCQAASPGSSRVDQAEPPTRAEGRLRTADGGITVQPSAQPMPTLARLPYRPSAVPWRGLVRGGKWLPYPADYASNTRLPQSASDFDAGS